MIGRWLLFLFVMIGLPAGAALQHDARKPTLFVVHSDDCGPCVIFGKVWTDDPAVRHALQDAFDVRELDWNNLVQRAEAIAIGVRRLPSFVVVRGDRRIAFHEGFAGSQNPDLVASETARLMASLNVEWPPKLRQPAASPSRTRERPEVAAPRPKPPREDFADTPNNPLPPAPAAPAAAESIDLQARDGLTKLASQTRDLQAAQQQTQHTVDELQGSVQQLQSDVAGVQSEVTQSSQQLSQQLQESHESTRSDFSRITDQLRKTIRNTIGATDRPDISTEIPSTPPAPSERPSAPQTATPEPGVASWLIKAGLTGAAVYFGLPVAGAGIGAAAVTWLIRRRRGKATGAAASDGFPKTGSSGATLPREYGEAVELLQLAEREGRLPIHEALRGTMAGDEIDKLCADADPVTRQLGTSLRDRIAQRFNTVAPISQNPKSF